MQAIYEIEIFEECGMFVAIPFDFAGGTQGESLKECYEMTADYLRTILEEYALEGQELPVATYGNTPKHGGKVVVFSVVAGLDTIEKVSKADAARLLGISPGRVTQLLSDKKLESFFINNREWVTKASVQARLEENPLAGRPRRRQRQAIPQFTISQNHDSQIAEFSFAKKTTNQGYKNRGTVINFSSAQLKEG